MQDKIVDIPARRLMIAVIVFVIIGFVCGLAVGLGLHVCI